MTAESVLRDSANRAYITAFLLSGSGERAEAAVLEGIKLMNSDAGSAEELFQGAVNAALELKETLGQRALIPGMDVPMLPCELQYILQLPEYPRHCFVLRFLLGWPRRTCARLLRSRIDQIDEATGAALSELQAIIDKSARNHSGPHNEQGVKSRTRGIAFEKWS
jgi:hypothetical protein